METKKHRPLPIMLVGHLRHPAPGKPGAAFLLGLRQGRLACAAPLQVATRYFRLARNAVPEEQREAWHDGWGCGVEYFGQIPR